MTTDARRMTGTYIRVRSNVSRFGQVGIAISTLGIMVALMGLFPGLTGVDETPGIGLVQVIMLLVGYTMLSLGAVLYVKVTFYIGIPSNLVQQIGLRLMLTGLLFASIAGLADILGFGSHLRTDFTDIFFGGWQAVGTLASLAVSSFGVLLYTVAGDAVLSDASVQDDLFTVTRTMPPA